MKKIYTYLIFLTISFMIYGFDTEYEVVNPISEEWETAGYQGELPEADGANTFYAGNFPSIQDAINFAKLHSEDNEDCICRVFVEATQEPYELNESLEMYSNIILSGNYMFRRDSDRTERTILQFDISGDDHNLNNCIRAGFKDEQGVIHPVSNVGIEDLLIERIDAGSSDHIEDSIEGNNIEFRYAENCWVYGVESYNPIKYHIHIGESNNISVKGCYLHDAQFHGEGGFGYGVIADYGTTLCLIENNVFNGLRHAMLVQNEAHWNVFGYNYVKKAQQTTLDNLGILGDIASTCIPGDFVADICCHGEPSYEANLPSGNGYRGPYENLFEGNICNTMWVDSFHGKNQEHNTFFRNKAGKYGFSVFKKLPSILDDRYYTKSQTEQIAINNYMKSKLHWTDAWEIIAIGGGVSVILPAILSVIDPLFASGVFITGLYGIIVFIDKYSEITSGRWVDVKPFEKNSIHRRKNFWGQYYTRTWTDNEYGTEENAWNDNSYYLSSQPEFWYNDINLLWPYHPYNSSNSPAERRYSLLEKKTVSRYNYPGLQTYWITDGGIVDESNPNINSDLFYNGNLRVNEGVTLVIDPSNTEDGIELFFAPNQSMSIKGSLIIYGSEEMPVKLSSIDIDYNNIGEEWRGIIFGSADPDNANTGDSELNYTIIENARKEEGTISGLGGGVYIQNGSYHYIDEYAEIIFNNCEFRFCRSYLGGAVYIEGPAENELNNKLLVSLSECKFTYNHSYLGGGALNSQCSNLQVVNCNFSFNESAESNGGAINIYCDDPPAVNPLLIGNAFYSNSAERGGALYVSGYGMQDIPANPILINNTFVNNSSDEYGGALMIDGPGENVVLLNNVFYFNTSDCSSQDQGGGNQIAIELDSASQYYFFFRNNNMEGCIEGSSIFSNINDYSYNNGTDWLYVYDPASEDVNDFIHRAQNNINANPEMNLNMTHLPISDESPCFDAGLSLEIVSNYLDNMIEFPDTDLRGNPRPSGATLDIGHYEAYDDGLYLDDSILSLGNVNPDSPVSNKLLIRNQSYNRTIDNISCEIIDGLDTYLEITSCPSTLSIQSQDYIVLKFSPTKMYENYEGTIIISSDDVFIPEIRIPFYANTDYHSGWNYVSFPFEYLDMEEVLDGINPFAISISSADGYMIYDETNREWDNYGLTEFINTDCYQVNMSYDANSYDIDLDGGNPYAVKTLYPNQKNWIGYWQDGSQNIDDAFGDDFDKLISIKSECWFYGDQIINPDRETEIPVSPSKKMRALHYGRGYIVKVSEIIEGFNWNYTGNPYSKEAIEKSAYFTYEQTSDYTAIDVIGLDDSVEEIAAFVDSTCIGAAVVKDNQAQILAYKDEDRFEVDIIFKLYNQRNIESVDKYYVFNNESFDFESGTITLNNEDFYFVTLKKDPNAQGDIPEQYTLFNNFPNPFNPETTISFSLPEADNVDVSIFNIKGQKVRTLLAEYRKTGYHSVVWSGNDDWGRKVSSGVYFYKLAVNGKIKMIKKCLLLK